jgi:glycosyltransferase involved in cell wall biosynthesis
MNLGRINPQNYEKDPSFRGLIDVVGTGFPDTFPETRPYLRGVHESIPEDAKMVLWGGGIWNWLDPLSLIEAWPDVLAAEESARLVFLGTKHPNPAVPAHEMAVKAMRLAEKLGEKDRSIIFIEWVPFNERVNLLAEADVGVTMHPVHIETRYSIRTRVLDYFWARLPVVITEGDITSEWIQEYGLGRVVPEKDPEAISTGLLEILKAPEPFWEEGFARIYADFKWSKLVQPLVRYCLEGDFSPDRPQYAKEVIADTRYVVRAKKMLFEKGPFHLAYRAVKHLVWRLTKSREEDD